MHPAREYRKLNFSQARSTNPQLGRCFKPHNKKPSSSHLENLNHFSRPTQMEGTPPCIQIFAALMSNKTNNPLIPGWITNNKSCLDVVLIYHSNAAVPCRVTLLRCHTHTHTGTSRCARVHPTKKLTLSQCGVNY